MDPVSIALIASQVAGATASAGGGLMGGYVQGLGYDYEANKSLQAAELIEKQWGYESWRRDLASRRFLGTQRAGFGAAGVELSGSAIDDLAESAKMMTLDKLMGGWMTTIAAAQHRADAKFNKWAGKSARQTGVLSGIGNFLGGTSSLLSFGKGGQGEGGESGESGVDK